MMATWMQGHFPNVHGSLEFAPGDAVDGATIAAPDI